MTARNRRGDALFNAVLILAGLAILILSALAYFRISTGVVTGGASTTLTAARSKGDTVSATETVANGSASGAVSAEDPTLDNDDDSATDAAPEVSTMGADVAAKEEEVRGVIAGLGAGEGSATGNGEHIGPGIEKSADDSEEEPAESTVKGMVVDEEGRGLPSALLTVTAGLGGSGGTHLVYTDTDGSFTTTAKGNYTIVPSTDSGYRFTPERMAGMSGSTSDIVFRAYRPAVIDGIVVNEQGDPIVDAFVQWTEAVGAGGTLQTKHDGRFQIPNVHPSAGVREFVVTHPEYQRARRQNVKPGEGEQRVVLRSSNDIVLLVNWADGTPVTSYAYRLLKKTVNDFEIDPGRQEIRVDDPEGRTVLDQVDEGRWRAEIIVAGESGELSDIRGAADFELSAGQKGLEVPVIVSGGAKVKGTVTLLGDGRPLADVVVRLIPPMRVHTNPNSRFLDLDIPDVYTGADGTFAFEGVSPGLYTLNAWKDDDLVMDKPIDFNVGVENPEPLQVVLQMGAIIFGRVIGEAGTPIKNAQLTSSISSLRAQTYDQRTVYTDEEGKYEFRGALPAVHFISLSAPGHSNRKTIEVGIGEKKEVNFNFSERIMVKGNIRAASGGTHLVDAHFAFTNGEYWGDWFRVDAQGNYSTTVEPGHYTLAGFFDGLASDIDDTEILATPEEQTRDFTVSLSSGEVEVQFPEDAEFKQGQVVITPRVSLRRYNFMRLPTAQAKKPFTRVGTGEYQATFSTPDSEWQGTSGWVDLAPGPNNKFVIPVKRVARGIRVGGWQPEELATSFTTIEMDVTEHVQSDGLYTVIVAYERGRHAAAVEWAVLLEGAQEVARDLHDGWSGYDKANNSYSLPLDRYSPNARYTLLISIRADGGSDSTGSIYLNAN